MDILTGTPSIILMAISWLIIMAFIVVILRKFKWKRSKDTTESDIRQVHATVTNKYMTDNCRYSRSSAPTEDFKSMVEFTYDDKTVHAFDLPTYYDAFELKDSGMLVLENGEFSEFILDK